MDINQKTNKTQYESEKALYRNAVLKAHNIKITDKGFMCNDGDIFVDVWEALDHTISLDLMSRNSNNYYEILEKSPNHQNHKDEVAIAKQIFDVINTSPIFYEFHCNKCKEYLIFECKHYQALKRKYKVD